MDVLCRICIKKSAKCTSLNAKIENLSNLSFVDFLNKCTSINACQSDKLPQSLCTICARIIRTFYAFVKLAEKSDLTLREALKNSIASGKYKAELSSEEITIKDRETEVEYADFNKEDRLHCQATVKPIESSLILDIVKEEPCISESTTISAQIKDSNEFHSSDHHPEGSIEKPDDIISSEVVDLTGIDADHCDSGKNASVSILREILLKSNKTVTQETKIECSYKCKKCDLVFNDKEKMNTHCRNHVYENKGDLDIHDEENEYESTTICENGLKHDSPPRTNMGTHSEKKPFKCNICGKKFRKKSHISIHMESHEDFRRRCDLCGKEFTYDITLKRHMQWHKNPKPFKCEYCGKLLSRKYGYIKHKKFCKSLADSNEETHQNGSTENTSTECDITFSDKEEIWTHGRNHGSIEDPDDISPYEVVDLTRIDTDQSDSEDNVPISTLKESLAKNKKTDSPETKTAAAEFESSYRCKKCGKIFNDNEKFKNHCNNNVCGDMHECNICGRMFRKREKLEYHLKIHVEQNGYKCEICGNVFKHYSSQRKHMEEHNGSLFKCNICGKEFKRKSHIPMHMESHEGSRRKCDQCGKEFTYDRTLKRHLEWHKNPKPFKCEYCGKLLSRKCRYITHREKCKTEPAVAEVASSYRCIKCGMIFNNREKVKTHCRNNECGDKHIEKNGYKCAICGRIFMQYSLLHMHKKIHSERPFKCNICEKEFKKKKNLRAHMEGHEEFGKKCNLCGKEFKYVKTLSRHLEWHKNPKPFKCEYCEKLFDRKYRYNNHMENCKPVSIYDEEPVIIE